MSHSGTALIDPKNVFDLISLKPGMRLADLGCGRTGHFVFPAARIVGDTGIVYAVEIVRNILDSIKSRARAEGFLNVEAIWSDIEAPGKTPIPGSSLDGCFMVNVLHQVKNKMASLAEAARLLRKDGLVVVIDWKKRLGLLGPERDKMLKEEDVTRMAQDLGFKLIYRGNLNDYHYCLILKKN